MKALKQLHLLHRGSRRKTLPAHIALVVLFFIVAGVSYSAANLMSYARNNLVSSLPAEEILVEPEKVDVSFFRMNAKGAKSVIDSGTLNELSQLPGVREVYPIYYGQVPLVIEGSFLGQTFEGSVVVQGFHPAWIAQDIPGKDLEWKPGGPIPIVLNSQLLAMYNSGYAKSQGLPQLAPAAILNRSFDLVATKTNQKFPCKIVGMSNKVGIAICMPSESLSWIHQESKVEQVSAIQAVLKVANLSQLDEIKAKVSDFKLEAQEPNPFAAALAKMDRVLKSLGWFGAILVGFLVIITLNLSLSYLYAVKRRDYALVRAMGLSRFELRRLLALDLLIGLGLDLAIGLLAGFLVAKVALAKWVSPLLYEWFGMSLESQTNYLHGLVLLLFFLGLVLLWGLPKLWRLTRKPAGVVLTETR